ncbi:hypothetical protein PUNSTDRAFT_133784 [Punctularia strigosozonata HHB-11173 SS5]|uniref:uncharacterized protein n=1 Tax=Punctularia strigosozonata (strain HHB-11173) TaxID=741275 RepID=UPI00044185B6|nr:uncharacterized protein PUNSTDRAFT_133784 [Punctularia strigosozonata HHB-11173 SS5]EIN10014.1 hypothetical protein PUNSTDRAFT_133784 [Punctularia strigosozonata HHB-11173 SS5]
MAGTYGYVDYLNDTRCFIDQSVLAYPSIDYSPCTWTQGMVNFLNLTGSGGGNSNYIGAYCLNPPSDDDCPYGYCSQSDIAGPLVRIGAYLSNLFLSLLIFYSPDFDDIRESFQAQILTIYSLLFATSIAIFKEQLTKFHAVLSSIIVGSPVTLYLWVYATLSLFGKRHRLSGTLGPAPREEKRRGRHLLSKILVLGAFVMWLALVIFIFTAPSHRFSQPNCDVYRSDILIEKFYAAGGVILVQLAKISKAMGSVFSLPLLLTIVAWIVVIVARRKEIWKDGYSWHFWQVWHFVRDRYPFIHFTSVIALPFVYWVLTVELGLLGTQDNAGWNVSFGQLLALFIVVQPALSVLPLFKKLGPWFMDLTWVRKCFCCGSRRQSRRARAQIGRVPDLGELVQSEKIDVPLDFGGRNGSDLTLHIAYGDGFSKV